jgi:hypothetical protein
LRPDLIEKLTESSRGNAQGAVQFVRAANEDVPSSEAATTTPAGVANNSRTTMA